MTIQVKDERLADACSEAMWKLCDKHKDNMLDTETYGKEAAL